MQHFEILLDRYNAHANVIILALFTCLYERNGIYVDNPIVSSHIMLVSLSKEIRQMEIHRTN